MTWIRTIPPHEADGRLKTMYERIKGPDGAVDNIMEAHSLRPHTMEGHMSLYKHVLHNSANKLPVWKLEAIGVYVSLLNGCDYCVEHHFSGLRRLLNDDAGAEAMRAALEAGEPERVFAGPDLAMMLYANLLTTRPNQVTRNMIDELRKSGLEDGDILEINQVVAYFSYANRTVLGLGINTEGDVLGLSPEASEDANIWAHR
ncbi:carboxymuconolactone decarboxylase family protein [Sneathiella sp.]|uniref:carboxymuconolactone decarboxylase family protein n=1 Tax=Sneathiella sp. TaxID=1964365 RepID=UPI003565A518